MKLDTIVGLITIIGAFFAAFFVIDGRYASKEDIQLLLSGDTDKEEFFDHQQDRSEGVRAPDGSRKCKSGNYVCGLKYDHFQNDLTIEPICCKL